MRNNNAAIITLSEAIHNKAGEFALKRLQQSSGRSDITFEKINGPMDMSYDHWICVILVGFPGLKIAFHCHFGTKISRELTRSIFGVEKELDPRTCHDFIAEYCNMFGGLIKKHLQDTLSPFLKITNPFQVMLPTIIPSYDLYDNLQNGAFRQVFRLNMNSGSILCVSVIEINENEINNAYTTDLNTLARAISAPTISGHSEDVEFL